LARGYSITLKDGKAVKNASLLEEGDVLVTVLHQGKVESVVVK
jgi:exodeoxyribonuclease VII large subunit